MLRLISIIKPYSGYILTVWVIMIIAFSLTPDIPVLKLQTQKKEIRLDYLIHFCEYGFMAFMSYLAFSSKNFTIKPSALLTVTVCVILFAMAEELHQKMVPGRTFNYKDIISNLLGIATALGFFLVINRMSAGIEQ